MVQNVVLSHFEPILEEKASQMWRQNLHVTSHVTFSLVPRLSLVMQQERFHMTSWRPCWCPQTSPVRSCPVLWELYSYPGNLSFAAFLLFSKLAYERAT